VIVGPLRAALNGGERRENDFYPTPVEPTLALLPWLRSWPRRAWEPACGDGGMSKVLAAAGFDVVATDLIDRGYGIGGVDFLATTERLADVLITNPPFGDFAPRFIAHALALDVPYIAMLLNVNFWHANRRTPLWNQRKPEAVLALTFRPDFTGSGAPYFNCIWTLWGPSAAERTIYERIGEPGAVKAKILPPPA